jgi:O-antigen/teichoic acid export membrane protein
MFKTAKRVTVNTLAQLIARGATLLLSLVFLAALSRHVGDTGLGQYYLAQSLTMITVVLADFGLSTLAVRDIARQRDKTPSYITNLLVIKMGLLIIALIITAVLAKLGNYTVTARRAIYLMAIYQSLESLYLISSTVFQAHEQMVYDSLTQILGGALYAGLGILGVALGYDLIQILILLVTAGFAKFTIGLVFVLWRFARPILALDLDLCKYLLRAAVPFGVLMMISILYGNVHILVLSYFTSEALVGSYGAANRLIFILLMIPTAVMNAIFPVFSRLHASSADGLRISFQKSYNYLLLISVPIAVGMFLTADQIIHLIYGPELEQAIPMLRILAWLTVFKFVGYASGASLNATGREKLFGIIEGTFLVLNVVLDVVLIRLFGYIGIGYALLIVAGLDFVVYSVLSHRLVRLALPTKTITKSILATMIMALVIYGLRNSALGGLWLIIGSAALVYFAALCILQAFPRSDINAIYRLISQHNLSLEAQEQ